MGEGEDERSREVEAAQRQMRESIERTRAMVAEARRRLGLRPDGDASAPADPAPDPLTVQPVADEEAAGPPLAARPMPAPGPDPAG